MFLEKISPRFAETDALGHVNNTVIPVWFEQARKPVFQCFTPDLDPKKWRLIIARIEVDYLAEIIYGYEVEIRTYLLGLGNSSMQVRHDAYQKGCLCARGLAILVHYDYKKQKSIPIPGEIRNMLGEHIIEESTD